MVEGKGVQIKDHTRIDDNNIGIKVKQGNGANDSWFVFLKESTIGETNVVGIEVNAHRLAAQDCQLQDNGLYRIKALSDGHIVFEREHSPENR